MSWNTEWDKEFIEWDITSKLFLNMFDIRIYIYIYVRWTFMYYLTVDYLIPFQIESNLPDDCFRLFFGVSLLFEYFDFFEIQKNQNIFVLANFF